MSVDVDELVRKITAEVTKQVLAVIAPEPDDDWPDWDEFNQSDSIIDDSIIDDSMNGDSFNSHGSSLRSRLNGVTEEIVEDEDDEISQGTSTGNVTPIVTPFDNRRGGFDPRSNPSWFEAQYHREVLLPSRAVSR